MRIAIDIRNIGKKRTGDEVVFFNLVKQFSIIDKENQYILLTDRNPEKDADLTQEIKKLNLSSNFRVVGLHERGANKFSWNIWIYPSPFLCILHHFAGILVYALCCIGFHRVAFSQPVIYFWQGYA